MRVVRAKNNVKNDKLNNGRKTMGLLDKNIHINVNIKKLSLALLFCAAASAFAGPRTGLLHLSHVHRGGGKLERPDNTLETFKWCWENGSALECDCRKTKDGVGIMLHDKTLKRTARGIPAELAKKDVSLHTYYDPKAADPFVPSTAYLKKIIAEFHAHNIPVCSIPFEGGETEEVYFKLFELGCDGFSTDYPSVMFSVIRKLKE